MGQKSGPFARRHRQVRPATLLYATAKAACACCAAVSLACIVPFTVPGGLNPVTEVPGQSPRSPLIVVAPVLVTVLPARTAKFAADPRFIGACAAVRFAAVKERATAAPRRHAPTLFVRFIDPHFTS